MSFPPQASDYDWLESLGQGTFGTVYKGRCRRTSQIVALKVSRRQGDTSVLREMNILQRFLHDNVVRLCDIIDPENKPTLVLEFCASDLRKYMRQYGKQGALDQDAALAVMHQLLGGTAFCHRNGIMHRDLKPENLLLDSKGILKLADFGSARKIGGPGTTYTPVGTTLWYRAPEILLGAQTHNELVDEWSCGCIFAEMIQGHALFRGQDDEDQMICIMRDFGTPMPEQLQEMREVSPEIREQSVSSTAYRGRPLGQIVPKAKPQSIDLLNRLLMCNPAKRITAEKALWLTGVHLFKQFMVAPSAYVQSQARPRVRFGAAYGDWQNEANRYRPPAWG